MDGGSRGGNRSGKLTVPNDSLAYVTTDEGEDFSPSTVASPQWQPRTMSHLHRPSSIERLSQNGAVIHFLDWIQRNPQGWEQIHHMFHREGAVFAGGTYKYAGTRGVLPMTKRRWMTLLLRIGYPDEEALSRVFDEILLESSGGSLKSIPDWTEASQSPEITLSQFKRFERRVTSVYCTLDASDDQSPTSRFVKMLVKRFGSSLRAWRIVLDVHGTGAIAFSDFTIGCRKLGAVDQMKLVWQNLRADTLTKLEFHDLDPHEGTNLEEFCETLWAAFGFDLHKAWVFLDPHCRKVLRWEEFSRGVRALGFDGDVRTLFKGLDSSGFGRLNKDDFQYLLKVSRVARFRLGTGLQGPQAIGELIAWVQRELGGAHELILKLGLGASKQGLTVPELAVRLTALGFEGDSLGAATRVARGEGGTAISGEALYSLLTGGRPRAERRVRPKVCGAGPDPGMDAKARVSSPGENKAEWVSSLDNYSAQNDRRCKYTRDYFDPPSRAETKKYSYTSQSLGLSPRAVLSFRPAERRSADRPQWCSNFGGIERLNEESSRHTRQYFSDAVEKPMRAEQRAMTRQLHAGGAPQ